MYTLRHVIAVVSCLPQQMGGGKAAGCQPKYTTRRSRVRKWCSAAFDIKKKVARNGSKAFFSLLLTAGIRYF